jgi:hypothetical protein
MQRGRRYTLLVVMLFLFVLAGAGAIFLSLLAGHMTGRALGNGYQDSAPGVYAGVAGFYAALAVVFGLAALFAFAETVADGGAGRLPAWAFAIPLLGPAAALPFTTIFAFGWAFVLNGFLLDAIVVALVLVAVSVRKPAEPDPCGSTTRSHHSLREAN